MRYVKVNLEDSSVGMGWRYFLVAKEGTRWAELLYVPHAARVKVLATALKKAIEEPVDKKRAKRLIALLKANLADRQRYGFRTSPTLVKQAVASLTGIARAPRQSG